MTYETDEDDSLPNPNGCRWCGIDRHEHFQRWSPEAGLHVWTEPTTEHRKARMLARRARRERKSPGQTSELRKYAPKCWGNLISALQM